MSDTLVEDQEIVVTPVVVKPQGGYVAKFRTCRVHNDNTPELQDAREEPTSADMMRMEDGNVFETDIGDIMFKLLDPATSVFLTPDAKDEFGERLPEAKAAREAATIAAMDDGVEFIWNARLPADLIGRRIAEPDALARIGTSRKRNGQWAYAPLDVKHHLSMQGDSAPQPWAVSELSDPSFESAAIIDVGRGIPKIEDSLQLAHYHRTLEALGYGQETDMIWGGVIGKERRVYWRAINADPLYMHFDPAEGVRRRMSPLEIYDVEFQIRLDVIERAVRIANGEDLEPLAKPEWNASDCNSCAYRTVCHDDLEAIDHITLLQGVTPDKARAHYEVGITTTLELTRLDWHTASAIDVGLDASALTNAARTFGALPGFTLGDLVEQLVTRKPSQAKMTRQLNEAGVTSLAELAAFDPATLAYSGIKITSLADTIDMARVTRAERVFLRRGVEALDLPRGDVELHVDMENLPGGIIYLWGTWLEVRTPDLRIPGPSYRPFVTFAPEDHAGEAQAFIEMWEYIKSLQTICRLAGLTFRAYCYTAAENRCMRSLVEKHADVKGMPDSAELEAFIASDDWVDLFAVITTQTLWPTENLSLKSLAKYAKFSWRTKEASGDNSVVWYLEAVSDPDPDMRAASRHRVLEYNEDDVKATAHVLSWLEQIAGTRTKLAAVASLDKRYQRKTRPKAAKAAA